MAPFAAASSFTAAGTRTRLISSSGTFVAAATEFGSTIALVTVAASSPRESACKLGAGPTAQDTSGTSRWTAASSCPGRHAVARFTSPIPDRRICASVG